MVLHNTVPLPYCTAASPANNTRVPRRLRKQRRSESTRAPAQHQLTWYCTTLHRCPTARLPLAVGSKRAARPHCSPMLSLLLTPPISPAGSGARRSRQRHSQHSSGTRPWQAHDPREQAGCKHVRLGCRRTWIVALGAAGAWLGDRVHHDVDGLRRHARELKQGTYPSYAELVRICDATESVSAAALVKVGPHPPLFFFFSSFFLLSLW